MTIPMGPSNLGGQPKDSELAGLSDEELQEKLNPSTPAPQPDKVDIAAPEATKPAETPATPAPAPADNVDLVKENAKLKKQLDNLQQLYGRQSNELGEMRKKLPAEPTPEEFDADPVKAAKQLQERQKQEEKIQEMEQAEVVQATAIRNLQFISAHAPDIHANRDAMRELLLEADKVDEDDVNKFFSELFLQNPWGVYQLNERAKLLRRVKELEAKAKGPTPPTPAPKTAATPADINRAMSNVNASTGHSAAPETLGLTDDKALAGLSDDELQTQLKKLTKGK